MSLRIQEISDLLKKHGWFDKPGAYGLVDGQFGSTGKGVMAGLLAYAGCDNITCITTNQGPNSGHTAWHGSAQIILKQLPMAGVIMSQMGRRPRIYLNGGAIIDREVLLEEMGRWNPYNVVINPTAPVIEGRDLLKAQDALDRIASTGKGTGPALARKVNREENHIGRDDLAMYGPIEIRPVEWDWRKDVVLVEIAQGFSLGYHSHQFYPHVTSRECTVVQGLADARIPAQVLRKVVACYRTFPIRVGNTAGSSGGCYSDQEETTWAALGQKPELTTVTKRERRVFTWSRLQFRESVAANRPDVIFLNFAQYCNKDQLNDIVNWIRSDYHAVMGTTLKLLLMGVGPRPEDVFSYEYT